MTRAEEILIRSTARALHAAADGLMSLVAREEPSNVVRCPGCGSTNVAEAGDDLVCAECNANFKV